MRAAEEVPGPGADDGFATGDFLAALAQVVVGDGLEVVNVVEINIFEKIDLRLDVAGNGDINDKQRPVLARFEERREAGAVKNVMRGGGAADDDVGLGKFSGPIVEEDGASAEFGGEFDGALMGAVGDDDALDAAAEQGAGGFFTGVAGADDEGLAALEGGEDFFGEFDGNGADGDAAALDVGLGASCVLRVLCG